jgi:predicted RND superfamily exporter protein
VSGAATQWLQGQLFGHRPAVLVIFGLLSVFMGYHALQLRPDAGFEKSIPLGHPYMKTFVEHQAEFGGANRILVALSVENGDIFTPEFFTTLKAVTNEIFYIPGIDRPQVTSLVTPNVRFVEIVEDGFAGGNVVPADFEPTPEMLEQVRRNVLKTNEVGRLVSNDFSAAIVRALLLEVDPDTGERLDYLDVARQLEERVRQKYETDEIKIHIIGFAKLIGDVADGAFGVVIFFAITFLITGGLVYLYCRSVPLSALPLVCSVIAVVWQLGLLTFFGFGLDPMSILVPFLVFAIGVSHGVQMINAARARMQRGQSALEAARSSFEQLLAPCSVALASDTVGFLTLLLIDIGMIRELAITASLGVAVIFFTNLILLPVLLSYLPAETVSVGDWAEGRRFWRSVSRLAEPRVASVTVAIAVVLLVLGGLEARNLTVGDMDAGSPELRPESRYNRDAQLITERFSIGVDVLSVIIEAVADGCTRYDVMATIDEFEWHVRNVPGVQSAVALTTVAKIVNAGWNEGAIKWRIVPRNRHVLAQSVSGVETATGLLNDDCSVMPMLIFTEDHRAETLEQVVAAVEAFSAEHGSDELRFRLASGNAGVMVATNEAVRAAQLPTLLYVYAAIIALCLLTFRSVRGTLFIVLPLALVSTLAYALMAILGIGLKVSTLPVVALGVGVGVDYGIYIFARLREHVRAGQGVREAYYLALGETGTAVVFTGLTLAIGVSTWIFSALKFQADMGILLTFMFLMNMLGAVTLLPALAALAEHIWPTEEARPGGVSPRPRRARSSAKRDP